MTVDARAVDSNRLALDPAATGTREVRIRLGVGTQRTLSRLIVNLPFSCSTDGGAKKWVGSWLEKCGFEQKGCLEDVGCKLGQRYVSLF